MGRPTNFDILKEKITPEIMAEILVHSSGMNMCAVCKERPHVDHSNNVYCSWSCLANIEEWLKKENDSEDILPGLFFSRR